MTIFETITTLTVLAGSSIGTAWNFPRLFLRISRYLFILLSTISTAAMFWYLGLEYAHAALAQFIRPDADKEAALAIASLGIPLHFQLLLAGLLCSYGVSHVLAAHVDSHRIAMNKHHD